MKAEFIGEPETYKQFIEIMHSLVAKTGDQHGDVRSLQRKSLRALLGGHVQHPA